MVSFPPGICKARWAVGSLLGLDCILESDRDREQKVNTFIVGDIQGCAAELCALLEQIDLDAPGNELWLVGDLINRGPASVEVLRLAESLGTRCRVVLGNHDLSILARLFTAARRSDLQGTAAQIRAAPDSDRLIDWLRHQPLAHSDRDCLMIHAGLPPQWDLTITLACAAEVEQAIRGPQAGAYFAAMYGDEPRRWHPELRAMERLRYSTNCLTRLRYVTPEGDLALTHKGAPAAASPSLLPWFAHAGRRSRQLRIVFGHWSTLGQVQWPEHRVWGLDTGCVWGGTLTALHLESGRLIEVPGTAYRQPGPDHS